MNSEFWDALTEALKPQGDATQSFVGSFPKQAAVMVLITEEVSPEIIYTLRAKHLNQHAGEVCFPGGKWELQDQSLLSTALRETHEEIGLAPSMVDVLGALPARPTKSGAMVQPFVGKIPAGCRFNLNHHELEELFSVPLAAFQRGLQVRTDIFERNGVRFRMPAYVYEGYEIWGFTAGVTAELLSLLQYLRVNSA
ncbi:NUDIX hydrolase [Cellvibrio zantedeschiae]|uniref:NUDIX hydrolase n=1 Tax=Cellvibrio zantedeschiae TaxID=1237077 RepID=UPI001E60E4E8|nr:CoA pyrophosphatase [Cellvibrio zantedeschiae]